MKRFSLSIFALMLCVNSAHAVSLSVEDGLLYHLDASDAGSLGLSGSNVTSWSGGALSFDQANAGKQPTFVAGALNGQNAVRFDGADDELVLGSSTTAGTVIIVNNADIGGGLRGVWGSRSPGDKGIRLNNNTNYRSAGQNSDGNDFANGSPLSVTVNGELTSAYSVGTPHIVAEGRGPNFNAGAFNTTSIGGYFNGREFSGDVAEVIVYDRVLTQTEMASVQSELGAFYGIATNSSVGTLENIALGGKAAQQSSQLGGFGANLAVDGNLGNFTHTLSSDTSPEWSVDLGATAPITTIEVNNRGGGCCQSRLRDITVSVRDRFGNEVFNSGLLNPENVLGGGGTGGPGNLVIDVAALADGPVVGRTVVVTRTIDDDLSGTGGSGNADEGRVLSLGEVQVQSLNLARGFGVTASQSSQLGGFSANLAIDGNLGNFTHTLNSDTAPTFTLDLNGEFDVDSVFLHNRDSCCADRLQDIEVEAFDADGASLFISTLLNPGNAEGNPGFLAIDFHDLFDSALSDVESLEIRRLVNLQLPQNDNNRVLSLGEVQVFGSAAIDIPEPTTALLGLLGVAAISRRRRNA